MDTILTLLVIGGLVAVGLFVWHRAKTRRFGPGGRGGSANPDVKKK